MRVHSEELAHPTQASRVRLNVFELSGPISSVHGLDGARGGAQYLATEDRIGTSTVVATLGAYTTRDEALAVIARRSQELERQHYRRA